MPTDELVPNYAPPEMASARPLGGRVVKGLLAVLLIVTAVCVYRYGPAVWKRAWMLHIQSDVPIISCQWEHLGLCRR